MRGKESEIRVIKSPGGYCVKNPDLDIARLEAHLDFYETIMSEAPNKTNPVIRKGLRLRKK